MGRYDRMRAQGRPYDDCEPPGTKHTWQPVSFVFESQLLDGPSGRVIIRQPDTKAGRVYLVCMGCHSHTWIETEWTGAWIMSEEQLEVNETPLAKRHRGMRGVE